MWLVFGSSRYSRVVEATSNRAVRQFRRHHHGCPSHEKMDRSRQWLRRFVVGQRHVGTYVDDAITPGLQATFDQYTVLDVAGKFIATGSAHFNGAAQELLGDTAIDGRGAHRLMQFFWSVVPGLGHSAFPGETRGAQRYRAHFQNRLPQAGG